MAVTAGGSEVTTTTNLKFLPDIWADDALDAMEFEAVLAKLCNTKYESQMSIGRVLHIPNRSNIASAVKTEGITNAISFTSITEAEQQVTVSTYEYAAVLLEKTVQVQSKYNDRSALAHKLGYSLLRGIEVTIAALFQSFSQSLGTYGADIDDTIVRRAWQYLADAGYYKDAAWVFSPGAAQGMFGQDRFVSKDFQGDSGPNAIKRAQLPDMYNYPAYVSNLLRSPATGQHDNALLHQMSVILVRQQKPTVESQYRIEWNGDALLMWDYYAAVEGRRVTETPASDGATPTVGASDDLMSVLLKGQ